jgi:MscS family membrane protein
MRHSTWIAAAFILLALVATASCRAAEPLANPAVAAAAQQSLDKQKAADAAAVPKADDTAEKGNDGTPPALKSFTGEMTSFFNNPAVVGLRRNNSLFAWFMLLLWIFIGILAGRICAAILRKAGSRQWSVSTKFLLDLAGPANLFLIAMGLAFGLLWIKMDKQLRDCASGALLLIFYVSFFWYIYNLIAMVDAIFHRVGSKTDSSLAIHVAPLVRRTLRVFLVVIASMFIVQSVFKQDIGAWLAGLGIAGLAVSLAAQDSLKNLFGSITIIMDRSFRIGDRIICSGCDGVIEDIGLRTTRVRTAAGHLVSIPNANIVNSPVENVSRRQGIRRDFSLALKLDTPMEKVQLALKIVNDILAEKGVVEPIHPAIDGKTTSPRVVFSEYKPNGLILNVTYWFAPPNRDQYMTHAERVNMRILEEFNRAEIQLASS